VAVVIRLARLGAKRKPHHRIVVIDKHKPNGRFIEAIGYYDPSKEPCFMDVNADRAAYWLSVGAKPTLTVKRLLKSKKIALN